jgi:hypothetical protein
MVKGVRKFANEFLHESHEKEDFIRLLNRWGRRLIRERRTNEDDVDVVEFEDKE